MHIPLILEMAAEASGDRTALTAPEGSLSYAALQTKARQSARQIAHLAIDTIAYCGTNSLAFPVAVFASGLAGKPFAPLNYRLADGDLHRILARIAPALLIADDDVADRLGDSPGIVINRRNTFLENLTVSNDEIAEIDPQQAAIFLFTSGTTGEPKAALLRHAHLASYVITTVEFMSAEPEEATLISVPPYHVAGISAVLTSVYAGRRMVQLPAFTPETWVETAAAEQVTHAMLVPTMLGRVLDLLERRGERLPHLRHLSYGGGRMPEAVIRRALDLLPHVDFVNAYGLTETSSTIAVLDPNDHRLAHAAESATERRRLGSVGRPLPTLELEIRGPDGARMPVDEPGEIWVRGEQVSGEYVGRVALREDGWFPTNDCGWLDEGGFLYVAGRLDDIIVRGGENISPGEVEDVLRRRTDIDDVAVIGLPDDEWGERIVAVVVAAHRPSTDELKNWVRQHLRSSKVPQEVIFRETLPYNETGKLLRRILKAELSAAPPQSLRVTLS